MKSREIFSIVVLLILASCISSTASEKVDLRPTIDLSGTWQFELDANKTGIKEKYFMKSFTDNVQLPGTLDENKKGSLNKDTTDLHLNRLYTYEGPAWFKKEIIIPENWKGKNVELNIERSKVTHVWLDTIYLGSSNNIYSRQVYNLTDRVTPGKHTLTIMVDNTLNLVPVIGSHAYSEDTQTNWNGILGKFYLESSNKTRLVNIRIYQDIKLKQVKVKFNIENLIYTEDNYSVNINAELWNSNKEQMLPVKKYSIIKEKKDAVNEIIYEMGNDVQLWSEFNPALYKLTLTLNSNGTPIDNCQLDFGMREFKTNGKQFTINDDITFLRGKHDAAVFPLTGYPAMDTTGWLRVFRIARSYGINFYRYHTWCPPEAAFIAADITGIYMQPELPIWWGFNPEDTTQIPFFIKEGKNIMDNYANHPSFVMFALGNEISKDKKYLKEMVKVLRDYDNRLLYAQGSNNWLWDPSYAEGDDFWATFRTSKEKEDLSSDVRMSVSHLDSKYGDGGVLNTIYPSTSFAFSKAIEKSPVPVMGFEVGQYSIYPNYNEMNKYTGILKPWNLNLFRKRLAAKGMLDQADGFFKASGALSVLCYKQDIEAAIRTPNFGGFQLLDLQDYPGQGTALVGVLDAFMDSKGLITPAEFRYSCNDIVILLVMDKYCWTNDEVFQGEIRVANYSQHTLNNKNFSWSFRQGKKELDAGKLTIDNIKQGSVTSIGKFEIKLGKYQNARRYDISISMDGEIYRNRYPVWVFPAKQEVKIPSDIKVADRINDDVINVLNNGGKVLLFPQVDSTTKNVVDGQFISEFWNYGMFTSLAKQYKGRISPGTMGILTNPKHKIFEYFPTEFHSNWQWWPIVKNSHPVILDETDHKYRPIVQVIDNINRNYKLGLVFEFKAGKGKLLVCSSDLPNIDKPESQQLYYSILQYMSSNDFTPAEEVNLDLLNKILR